MRLSTRRKIEILILETNKLGKFYVILGQKPFFSSTFETFGMVFMIIYSEKVESYRNEE